MSEKENSNNAYNFVMVQFIVYDSNYYFANYLILTMGPAMPKNPVPQNSKIVPKSLL